MSATVILLGLLGVWFFASQVLAWQQESTRDLLDRWAHRERVKLVRIERRWLLTGPFSVTEAVDLPTFLVVARRPDGSEHAAWVRCGTYPWGVLDPRVDARWS